MCKAREHERSFNAILIILFVRRCARRAWLSRAIPRRGTRRGGGERNDGHVRVAITRGR